MCRRKESEAKVGLKLRKVRDSVDLKTLDLNPLLPR